LGAEKPCVEFIGGDWVDAIAERFEGRESRGSLCLRKSRSESYRGCGSGRLEEVTARDGSHEVMRMREEGEEVKRDGREAGSI
jgi:hypothetical protein